VNSRARWLVSALLILVSIPATASAQEAGWTFQGVGEFGGFFPTRSLGKNVTDAQELRLLQATATLDAAPMFGAGIEVIAPDDRLMVRGIFRQTIGGTSAGSVIICEAFDPIGACAPNIADATVSMMAAEVIFLQGDPAKSLRHNFLLGAGLRSYQMTTTACVEDPTDNNTIVVCRLVEDIYREQASVQPFLDFGFGFIYEKGPLSVNARLIDTLGPYSGGGGNASGTYQNDFLLTGGLALRVR